MPFDGPSPASYDAFALRASLRGRRGNAGMDRRLAAILIVDVVGYVRLSQADEEGTRARFQTDS